MAGKDDRRYRQMGYKDSQREGKREEPRVSRSPGVLKNRAASRCADCGSVLPIAVDPGGRCPQCGSELHACGQCSHFDSGRRFECAQPVVERITDKRARNACALFSLRVTVERETSSASVRPKDARRGFDSLFKKP